MLKVKNLEKIYGQGDIQVAALKKVSFEIARGEFVSIVGHSGSGKSTLMNILGCLDKPTSGEYILDQREIKDLTDQELGVVRNSKIGFVFQSFNLLPRLSAFKNVELSMIYAGIAREERIKRSEEVLKRVGLGDRMHHLPTELSGGQKQRVAIARALVNSPAILLADEPTGNLDSESTREILEIFKELHGEGVTILLVTHEDDVAAITNRRLFFADGELVKDEEVSHDYS
ncbi:MAG: macrolide ABC transporter ATP-binding protein [delta proteobacterium ML8_F1]|nr:MAG: macrolide ABC transporter ATP-binding protein [delta proteobacterium ML8_F1]